MIIKELREGNKMRVKELKEKLNDTRIDENWNIEIGIVPASSKYPTKYSDALMLRALNEDRKTLYFELFLFKQ